MLPGLAAVSGLMTVINAPQPPCSNGFWLARRATTLPQSIDWRSTFRPMLSNISRATSDICFSAG